MVTNPSLPPLQRQQILERLGHDISSDLVDLQRSIPDLKGALLCTVDGFNVCAVGVNREEVGRMASLVSSLSAIGEALFTSVVGRPTTMKGRMVMMAEDHTIGVAQIETPQVDDLVLLAIADHSTAGTVISSIAPVAKIVNERLNSYFAGSSKPTMPVSSAPVLSPLAGAPLSSDRPADSPLPNTPYPQF